MTATSSSRRRFLRGSFRTPSADAMRPPWSVPDFADLCTGCGDCVAQCPEGIIVRDEDRFPVVDVSRGACTFCGACAEACASGALDSATDLVWDWRARVDVACLSLQGVTCRACEDVCDARAIRFRLATGGRSQPILDLDQCIGCGACVHACPAGAVTLGRREPEETRTST